MIRAVVISCVVCTVASTASAQTLQLSAQTRDIYAELPFIVIAEATGFDEDPQPEISGLEIAGADTKLVDVSPSVSQSITVFNGQRSVERRVSFRYAFRVTVHKAGPYTIPALTAKQGTKTASSNPAMFRAREVEASNDMKFRVGIPERPVWVGETFELTLDWYLRRDPRDPSFAVPLFESDQVEVNAPRDGKGDGTLEFLAGAREIELPYTRSTETLDGTEYTRFRFHAVVTPMRPGTLDMPAAKVVSSLVTAGAFRRRTLGIYKAEDRPRSLEIRPLPLKGRPDSFANAVGSGFSMEVQAKRTVVQVGDPLELQIRIRGDSPLEGVSLPKLSADGGLSPELFDIPEDQPPGTMTDGGGKTFLVTVRLKSADAHEIPPLAFSYFDPKSSEYKTVRSQPIALSVAGSAVVGAKDVVGTSSRSEPGSKSTGGADTGGPVSLVGADLALSSPSETLHEPLSTATVMPGLVILYAVPLLVFGFRVWRVRTRDSRAESGELRRRERDARRQLEAAATEPGRQVAPKLVTALKALAKSRGADVPADIVEELETQAYNPSSAEQPLSAALRTRIEKAIDDMTRSEPAKPRVGAAATVVLVLVVAGAAHAGSSDTDGARGAYSDAIAQTDRDARTRGFAKAELAFRDLVAQHPGRPELLADWGNAALGAQDRGRATLAYRRALYYDSGLERARKNLGWVRDNAPSWLATPESKGAIDSLFFWHHALTLTQRHIAAALGFCAFILLLTPWGRRDRLLRKLSLAPLALFVAMVVSIGLEADQSRDVVVVADGVVLRSADSVGAPPTLANPLPAGAEAAEIETRDSWARVALVDGTRGWVPRGVIEHVVPGG